MAEPILIEGFKGLQTGLTKPEVGSSSVLRNMLLNDVQGNVSLADGYEEVFPLPQNDEDLGISNFAPLTVHTFFVPDHGGKTVTLLTANYTKAHMGVAGSTNTFGMWIRPYWSGAAWVDDWFELTEMYVFRMASKAGSVFTLSNTTTPFSTAIDANALDDFIVVRDGNFSLTTQNFLKVTASTWGAGTPTITVLDTLTSYDDWVNDTSLLYVFRSFFNKSMPTVVQAHVRRQLDEIRLSTGRQTTDLVAATFFREKTFGWTGGARDAMFAEPGCLDLNDLAWKITNITTPGSASPLPEGTYRLATSLQLDDGQETELRVVPATDVGGGVAVGANSGAVIATIGRTVDMGDGYIFARTSISAVSKIRISDWTVVASYNHTLEVHDIFSWNGSLYFLASGFTGYQVCRLDTSSMSLSAQFDDPNGRFPVTTSGTPTTGALKLNETLGEIVFDVDELSSADFYTIQFQLATMTEIDATNMGTDDTLLNVASIFQVDYNQGTYSIIFQTDGDIRAWNHSSSLATVATPAGFTGTPQTAWIVGTKFYLLNTAGEIFIGDVGTWNSVASWLDLGVGVNDIEFQESDKFVISVSGLIKVYDDSAVELASEASTGFFITAQGEGETRYLSLNNSTFTPLIFAAGGGSESFELSGFQGVQFEVNVSPSLMFHRAKAIRIWLQRVDVDPEFVVCKEISLLSGETVFDAAPVYNATVEHLYYQVDDPTEILGSDYNSANSDSITQLGRDDADSGVITYEHSITAGSRAYAVGVVIGGKLQRNKVIASTINGEGLPFYDVFANDEDNIIDVEFNDGNFLKAVAGVIDRILCLKNKSVVLLTPQNDFSYRRDIVDYGVGIAAVKSLVTYGESAYWLDHSGVYRFSGQGLEYISLNIQDQLDSFTDQQREDAFATIDSKYAMYRLHIGGTVFVFDLVLEQWSTEVPTHEVIFMSEDLQDDSGVREVQRYFQLTRTEESPEDAYFLQGPVADSRHDGQSFEAEFVTSKIHAPGGGGWNLLVHGVGLEFEADVAGEIFVDFYGVTGEGVELSETVEVSLRGDVKKVFRVRPGFKCKTLRVGIRVSVDDDGQDFSLSRMTIYLDQFPDQETL